MWHASSAPIGVYWCANCRPTWCRWPELCPYWLTQIKCCLWLVTHKMALHWYERLAGSSGTKLIGEHRLAAWFWHLLGNWCFISTKNQSSLQKIQKPAAALIKTKICPFSTKFLKSISWDSPFKQGFPAIFNFMKRGPEIACFKEMDVLSGGLVVPPGAWGLSFLYKRKEIVFIILQLYILPIFWSSNSY